MAMRARGLKLQASHLVQMALALAGPGLLWHGSAAAQSTSIIPDSVPGLSTGTAIGVRRPEPSAAQVLEIRGGTLRGKNLFHSFQRFDLGPSAVALWTSSDPARVDVRNIINRVTGGDVSDIYGVLDSTAFPNADFYFINPAGIVFGENAGVNVPRAFYVSTADRLTFADGSHFNAVSGNGSTLSMTSPESFGFIGGQGGSITIGARDPAPILSGGFRVGAGQAAHFSASDITISSHRFGIFDAMVRLAAVGRAGVALPVDPLAPLPDLIGRIDIIDGSIRVGSFSNDLRGRRAALALSAGEIRLESTLTDQPASIVSGGTVTSIGNSLVFDGGDIDINAARLFMRGSSHIGILGAAPQVPFELRINARDRFEVRGNPALPFFTSIGETPFGGDVGNARLFLRGGIFDMSDAQISTTAGLSGAGSFELAFDTILLNRARLASGTKFPLTNTAVGNIALNARFLSLVDSTVTASTVNGGPGGDIRISADRLEAVRGQILSGTGSAGRSGDIRIAAREAAFTDSLVSVSTSANGKGGSISMSGDRLDLVRSSIFADTVDAGDGGNIDLNIGRIAMTGGLISARSGVDGSATGHAGNVTISARDLTIDGGAISSEAFDRGNGGNIRIAAEDARLSSARLTAATSGSGHAGSITLQSASILSQGSQFETSTSKTGAAGDIRILGGRLVFTGGILTSSTSGNGAAGSISIEGEDISLIGALTTSTTAGVSRAGNIGITGNRVTLRGANIASGTSGSGDGGSLTIAARQVEATGGSLSATTSGTGAAGAITVRGSDTVFLAGTGITSRADSGSGQAGAILIDGGSTRLENAIIRATTQSDSNAGAITINAAGLVSIVGTEIENSSLANGNAGAITITGGAVQLTNATIASAATTSPSGRRGGSSGSVRLQARAGNISLRGTTVNTSAATSSSGSAGAISLIASNDILLSSSALLSLASNNSANSGFIRVLAGDRIEIGVDPADGRSSRISTATISFAESDPARTGGIEIAGRTISIKGLAERTDRRAIPEGRVNISTFTTGNQDAGPISIRATGLLDIERTDIISLTTSLIRPTANGNAGNVELIGQDIALRNTTVEAVSVADAQSILLEQPSVPSNGSLGNAGSIRVVAARDLDLGQGSVISSASSGFGRVGQIDLAFSRNARIDGLSRVDTDVGGNAVGSGAIRVSGGSGTLIISGAQGTNLEDRSAISSSTANGTRGGSIDISVGRLELRGGGGLFAVATEAARGNGGNVTVDADTIVMTGTFSGIQATALGSGNAGSIALRGRDILIADGGQISTNAIRGSAGAITLAMPSDGLLQLRGRGNPVSITTSSGAGTGGQITISTPLAIVSDGGDILALGQARGANVRISSRRLIRSTDVINQLAVDGNLVLDSDVNDVSQGTLELPISVLDPFGILVQRCASARESGEASRLSMGLRGPREISDKAQNRPMRAGGLGPCTN